MLNDKITHGLWLATITATTLLWGGCRSVPGLNRFVRSSEPSADVLAGTGPSATYPAPPSASATPQAIASVAGGTSGSAIASIASSTPAPPTTTQVAGIDVSPGFATPATSNQTPNYTASQSGYTAPQPNFAAASANGVYANNAGKTGNSAKPSPYTFGTKTFTPNTAPETSPVLPKTGYGNPTGSPYSKSAYGMPPTTAAANSVPSASNATASFTPPSNPAATAASNDSGPMGGFTLPTSIPVTATASLTPPGSKSPATNDASTNGASANATSTTNSFGLPSSMTSSAAPGPAFSTANASADSMGNAPGSYMPGSTGKTHGYPGSSSQSPATSGSFYR